MGRAYLFDYDNTLAPANSLFADNTMPLLLAHVLNSGADVAVVTAKSLAERDGLLNQTNLAVREALATTNCKDTNTTMTHLRIYSDSGATLHVNNPAGELMRDSAYQRGFDATAVKRITRLLNQHIELPDERLITYPGSTGAQYALTDGWANLGHAIAHPLDTRFDAVPDASNADSLTVKLLVKAYGWEESAYAFERTGGSPDKTGRAQLAARINPELAATVPGASARRGGSVALDITAANKSRAVQHMFDLGFAHISYYGDDPEGSDQAVFELAESGTAQSRFPGINLIVHAVDNPQQTTVTLARELAETCAATIMAACAQTASTASTVAGTDSTEANERTRAINVVAAIATMTDADVARAGLRSLFGGIVEPLNDAYSEPLRLAYYRTFAQVINFCRHTPEGTALDQQLAAFGLDTARDLEERTLRIRQPRRLSAEDCAQVRQVFVLSRVTLGAEIALTSLVFAKALQAFANAEIVFIGSNTAFSLFADNPRLRLAATAYERKGGLTGRLNTWLELLATLRAAISDPSHIVIDADTRLSQIGLLPLLDDDQRYYFFDPTLRAEQQLADALSGWLEATFVEATAAGRNPAALTGKLFLPSADHDVARAMLAPFTPSTTSTQSADGDSTLIGIHLGTGGATDKMLSPEFETSLILQLLQAGATVLLYKGVDTQEEQRSTALLTALGEHGVNTVEVSEVSTTPDAVNNPRVIAFAGTRIGVSAALLAACQHIICYSSSSKHIAGALGVPVSVIFVRDAAHVDRWVPRSDAAVSTLR